MGNLKTDSNVLEMSSIVLADGEHIVLDMPEMFKFMSCTNDWSKGAIKAVTGHTLVSMELAHSTQEKKHKTIEHSKYGARTSVITRYEWRCAPIIKFINGKIFKKLAKDQPFLKDREVDVLKMVTTYNSRVCTWARLPIKVNNYTNGTGGWHKKLVLTSVSGVDAAAVFANTTTADLASMIGFVTARVCVLKDKPGTKETHCGGYLS